MTVYLDIDPFVSIGPFRFGASLDEICAAAQEVALDHEVQPVYRWWEHPTSVAHRGDRGIPATLAVLGLAEVVTAGLLMRFSEKDELLMVEVLGTGRRLTTSQTVEVHPVLFGVKMFAAAADKVVAAVEAIVGSAPVYPETSYNAEFPSVGVAMWRDGTPQKAACQYAQTVTAYSDWYWNLIESERASTALS